MTTLDKKTTPINLQPHKPLSVEWHTHHPHVRQSGKSFTQIDEHRVVLFAPETPYHPEAYLVSMLPGTALKLLKWLQENEELLTQLANKAQEA